MPALAGICLFVLRGRAWSRIFFVPSHEKFRDPGSRFRLLAKHRCALQVPHEKREGAFLPVFKMQKNRHEAGLLHFVAGEGLAPPTSRL